MNRDHFRSSIRYSLQFSKTLKKYYNIVIAIKIIEINNIYYI